MGVRMGEYLERTEKGRIEYRKWNIKIMSGGVGRSNFTRLKYKIETIFSQDRNHFFQDRNS
jgi:hypothetical protein